MREYMLSTYLERLDNMIEDGCGLSSNIDPQLLNQLKEFILEIYNDGFHKGLSYSETLENRHDNPYGNN